MTNQLKTGALSGIDGLAVTVETDISRGLPGFHLVGLPSTEVRESRERVLSALRNSGFKIPLGKITINLAPAGVRKEGASYDLAIAMSVVAVASGASSNHPHHRPQDAVYLGELSLFGDLRPVRGLLSIVMDRVRGGDRWFVVPAAQAWEARLVEGANVVAVENLAQVVAWWRTGRCAVEETEPVEGASRINWQESVKGEVAIAAARQDEALRGLAGLKGQSLARKAAILAITGRHNLLLVGPPGTGKTRLARLLSALQPGLSSEESLEVTRIHSAAGALNGRGMVQKRPFRAPHHTITRAGLIGGGTNLRPGEATLAHGGVLFLDELAEFAPAVLDVLREPLEEGRISVVRGPGARVYPAAFQLIAAMNPCRCGFLGSSVRDCRCSAAERGRYLSRISGPLLDRFDLFVEVGTWEGEFLRSSSQRHAEGVREKQSEPLLETSGWRRSIDATDLREAGLRLAGARDRVSAMDIAVDDLDPEALAFLEGVRRPLGLSLRGLGRCISVARTIAALDGTRRISEAQAREALEFRWGNLNLEPA